MTNDHQTCHSNKSALRLPFAFPGRDERLNFVEHVLDVLSESRTGRRRIFRIEELRWMAWLPEFDIDLPDSFYDLTERMRTHASRFFSIASSGCRPLDRIVMTSVKAADTGSTAIGCPPAQLSFAFPEFPALLPLPRGSP